MRTRTPIPGKEAGPAAVACAILALVLSPAAAAPPVARGGTVARGDTLTLVHAPAADAAVAVRRAAFAWRRGDLAAVVDVLEPLDFSHRDGFADTDRAAYLLARAHLARGERERFTRLARTVGAWPSPGPYGEAIAFERLMLAPAGDADAARLLAVATADTTTPAGRDRAAAATLLRAAQALERGEDPRALLATVPPTGRQGARALHLAGLDALVKGDGAVDQSVASQARSAAAVSGAERSRATSSASGSPRLHASHSGARSPPASRRSIAAAAASASPAGASIRRSNAIASP